MKKRRSRSWIILGIIVLIGSAMSWAFWPRALMVDIGQIQRGHMIVTINEEGKTRVRESYVVSTPVAGRLLRIEVDPGDNVVGGTSIVARMMPSNPAMLDARTREQARSAVTTAEAAVRVALANLNKAKADKDLADLDLNRKRELGKRGAIAETVIEQAESAWRSAGAALDQANASISMRRAELANARAQLIDFDGSSLQNGDVNRVDEKEIPIIAPISGRILRVLQKSETTFPAGKEILEIGDVSNDLEIVSELLSTDAVRVSVGDRVIISNWGGPLPLSGVVERVDPWGFTKFSALGVEEQRVNAVIRFSDPLEERNTLGHGFRVETQIVIWEDRNALTVPSSALFRQNENWFVYLVENGKANLRKVSIGHNNGVQAQITEGLEENDNVILYPGSGLEEGASVVKREFN